MPSTHLRLQYKQNQYKLNWRKHCLLRVPFFRMEHAELESAGSAQMRGLPHFCEAQEGEENKWGGARSGQSLRTESE